MFLASQYVSRVAVTAGWEVLGGFLRFLHVSVTQNLINLSCVRFFHPATLGHGWSFKNRSSLFTLEPKEGV